MRITELAYRVGRRQWTILWDADVKAAIAKRDALQHLIDTELPEVRVDWDNIKLLHRNRENEPMRGDVIANRFGDLIIRKSLFASRRTFSDANQVRLGTNPIRPSAIASSRLDKEVNYIRKKNE